MPGGQPLARPPRLVHGVAPACDSRGRRPTARRDRGPGAWSHHGYPRDRAQSSAGAGGDHRRRPPRRLRIPASTRWDAVTSPHARTVASDGRLYGRATPPLGIDHASGRPSDSRVVVNSRCAPWLRFDPTGLGSRRRTPVRGWNGSTRWIERKVVPGAAPSTLWDTHRKRLDEAGGPWVIISDAEVVCRLVDGQQRQRIDHSVGRGHLLYLGPISDGKPDRVLKAHRGIYELVPSRIPFGHYMSAGYSPLAALGKWTRARKARTPGPRYVIREPREIENRVRHPRGRRGGRRSGEVRLLPRW